MHAIDATLYAIYMCIIDDWRQYQFPFIKTAEYVTVI